MRNSKKPNGMRAGSRTWKGVAAGFSWALAGAVLLSGAVAADGSPSPWGPTAWPCLNDGSVLPGFHLAACAQSAGPALAGPTGRAPGAGTDSSQNSSAGEKEHWLKGLGRAAASVLGRTVLYAVLLVGLVLIPLGLGGTFVMVAAAAVFGLISGFEQVTLKLLALLLGLALLGEGIESVLGVAMARRYGASKWGMWGAFLGGIAGAILGTPVPVVGNVVGALAGVFLGAFALEWIGQGRSGSSLRAGWGALLGRTAAGAIKLALGMVIMILIISRTLS